MIYKILRKYFFMSLEDKAHSNIRQELELSILHQYGSHLTRLETYIKLTSIWQNL